MKKRICQRQLLTCLIVGTAAYAAWTDCRAQDVSVSGNVTVFFSTSLKDDEIVYERTGVTTNLEWTVPPKIISIGLLPSALNGSPQRWGDPLIWDSFTLALANIVTVFQTVVGVTSSPLGLLTIPQAIQALQNLGPTEQTLTITPFKLHFGSDPSFTVPLTVGLPLKFNVTLASGSNLTMDQSPVAIENLTVASGANLAGNGSFTTRHDLSNHGSMTGLGGSVEGNFLNNGTATANNLSVLGPFANPGSLTFTSGSLYRSAATTNDGTITLRGGGLSLSNGLTNKGVLNGYGLPLRFSIENYGLIAADVSGQTLTIGTDGTSTPTINNYGTIRIINGGVLSLIGAAINGGTITANNGTVATSFTTINGSTLNGNSGDLFTVSNSTFNQVTNNAPVQASGLNIQGGTLVNNNTITAVGFSSAYGSALYFSGATNLTGSGEIALQSASITGSTVTSNQLIHGSGLIRNSINSYGGIAADVSGQTLTIGTDGTSTPTINNYGSIRIINGGVLSLIGAAINGGTITANNGTVTTSFTTINGSTLNGSTGDLFTVSNSTFNQVTNNAPVDVTGLNIQGGTLVNNNTITARGFSSAYGSALYFSGATNLTGSGEIALQSASITGSTVTSNQLIHGSGLIRNSINSYGGIAANVSGQTLTIGTDGTSTPTINNYGTIRIINGGVLSLIGAAINGGTITANNGTVATSFTTINGSTLNGNSGDLFTVSNSTFNQVTNNAPVDATGLNIQGGTLVNNNTITARGFSSAYGSALYFSSATNLTGTGEIVFANANSTGGRITQEFGHTLRGNGSIGNPVVNGGVLEPGLGIGTLSVNNTVSLLDSSILRFELGGLAQGVTYDYLAIGGSMQLDGILSLDVSYDLKLQLAESDVFTIITSNDLSGSFDNGRNGDRITTGDGLASFIINYGPTSPFAKNNVVLSQGQIVPEPSSLILAAVGLGGYFSIRRRKNTA